MNRIFTESFFATFHVFMLLLSNPQVAPSEVCCLQIRLVHDGTCFELVVDVLEVTNY